MSNDISPGDLVIIVECGSIAYLPKGTKAIVKQITLIDIRLYCYVEILDVDILDNPSFHLNHTYVAAADCKKYIY